MPFRYPPITALRALESAARHLNFTRAAEELHVTQSAISHQIRHVEGLWQLKLFEKQGRTLTLTESGQVTVPVVRDFLNKISATVEGLQRRVEGGAIRVSLLQSLAFKWLVPRLGHFNERHPGVDVWISTSEELADLSAGGVDVGIRLGRGNYPDLKVIPLLREFVFPVASPYFLKKHGMPETPADLHHYPLLYRTAVDICPRWRDWFRDAGCEPRILPHGTHFPDTSMAVQAAMDHQGIALARSAHVSDDLNAGRLVKLFTVSSLSPVAYHLACRPESARQQSVADFIAWLTAEARQSQEEFDRQAGLQQAA